MIRSVTLLLLLSVGSAHAGPTPCSHVQEKGAYRGPLFDAMAQIESGMSARVTDAVHESGVTRMALFARLHPKRNGEDDVALLKRRFEQRFVIGMPKSFDQKSDLSDAFVERTLSSLKEKQFKFVGEILFAHADKSHGEQTADGERYVTPDGRNVTRLLTELQGQNMPVMIHWEVYAWERDWPAFHSLYSRFPNVTFIWPHGGFASADQIQTVLSSHSNVIVTLSKKERVQRSLSSQEKNEMLGGAIVDRCGTLLLDWRALLEKYPDRFMFATDAHKNFRWARYSEIVNSWRLILGQLPEPIAYALAWGNAERVYATSR